jgi:hypothetical protein
MSTSKKTALKPRITFFCLGLSFSQLFWIDSFASENACPKGFIPLTRKRSIELQINKQQYLKNVSTEANFKALEQKLRQPIANQSESEINSPLEIKVRFDQSVESTRRFEFDKNFNRVFINRLSTPFNSFNPNSVFHTKADCLSFLKTLESEKKDPTSPWHKKLVQNLALTQVVSGQYPKVTVPSPEFLLPEIGIITGKPQESNICKFVLSRDTRPEETSYKTGCVSRDYREQKIWFPQIDQLDHQSSNWMCCYDAKNVMIYPNTYLPGYTGSGKTIDIPPGDGGSGGASEAN